MFGRKAKIKWNGEEHDLVMSMEVVESIDHEINVLATAIELDKGGIPKVTVVAKTYAVLLQACGVDVTKDEVYQSIMSDPASTGPELTMATKAVLGLCFPELESAERPEKVKKKGKG